MTKPWINLYNLWDQDRIGLLAFESVGAQVVLSAEELKVPLSRLRGLQDGQVEFTGGKIIVRARFHGMQVRAVAHAELHLAGAHPYLEATLDRISIAGIPLPGWILGKAYRQTLWLEPQPSFPGRIKITHLTLDHNLLTIE